MSADGPTLGSGSVPWVDCTVRTADRIDEALTAILSPALGVLTPQCLCFLHRKEIIFCLRAKLRGQHLHALGRHGR